MRTEAGARCQWPKGRTSDERLSVAKLDRMRFRLEPVVVKYRADAPVNRELSVPTRPRGPRGPRPSAGPSRAQPQPSKGGGPTRADARQYRLPLLALKFSLLPLRAEDLAILYF
jgi:hypothetical protein